MLAKVCNYPCNYLTSKSRRPRREANKAAK
jgi:hypothetical protein